LFSLITPLMSIVQSAFTRSSHFHQRVQWFLRVCAPGLYNHGGGENLTPVVSHCQIARHNSLFVLAYRCCIFIDLRLVAIVGVIVDLRLPAVVILLYNVQCCLGCPPAHASMLCWFAMVFFLHILAGNTHGSCHL
jgi:hypothetical protein